jgi:hypothetical protein
MTEFDADTEEFLQALKPGSRDVYKVGLAHFQRFYEARGTIKDFLDRVEQDQAKPRRERKRVGLNVLKEFMLSLQEKKFAAYSIRSYIRSVQSLAQYFEITISLKHLDLPPALAQTKKYNWTLEKVSKFFALFTDPMYKAIGAIGFQSGLGISDALAPIYGDIKEEYENGITPLCFDLARIKTDTPFMTFLGNWGVNTIREYLQDKQLQPDEKLFPVGVEAVEDHFRHITEKFIGPYEGRNPCGFHTLRAGFRTLLGDQKVDPLYIEFWMGHSAPEQQKVYVSKSREGWRKTYREQAEPHLTPVEAIVAGSPKNPF